MTSHDFGSGIVDAIKFDQPEPYFVIIGLAILAFFIIRTVKQLRDPEGRLVGDMEFMMKGQKFAGKVFEKEGSLEIEKLDQLALAENKAAQQMAEVLKAHRNKLHFYEIKLMPMKGGTLQSGLALLMTHQKLDHPEWSSPIGSHVDLWWGRIHLRQANPAMEEGRVWRDGLDILGKKYHLIYYPMVDLKAPTEKDKLVLIENPHATLSVAAWMNEYIRTERTARLSEIRARAAENAKEKAESELKIAKEEYNWIRRQWAKKDYWASNVTMFGTSLSSWIVVAIVGGSAVILPDILARFAPGYDLRTLVAFAVILGALGVAFVSQLMKKGRQ